MFEADAIALSDSPQRPVRRFWRDLWFRIALQGVGLVVAYFLAWEAVENALGPLSRDDLHLIHLVRGAGAAFMLATWSFFSIRRARAEADATIERHLHRLEGRVRERTAALEEARAFTELLFDSLHERIVVRDASGRVVKANRVAEAWGEDSSRVWDVEHIPMSDRHGGALVIEVGRDVTEAKNLEAQIRHQEKMSSLGMLTAGFAHDLGNPLASLSSELELLEDERDLGQIHASLAVLRQQVARMSRTLREMVAFARRRRDEVADVSVLAAVSDSARLVCHDPRWKRVALVVDVPPELPSVHMVEDHLVLVLVNLMINAADAMPDGGTLTVSAHREGAELVLSLKDTGVGMTPDVLVRAKTPLFTTKGKHGTGLGLSVCEGVVHAMGGELTLMSRPAEGTEVRIRLPVSEAAHA